MILKSKNQSNNLTNFVLFISILFITIPILSTAHDTHKDSIDDSFNYEIISDSLFRAKNSMNQAQIQTFLEQKNSGLAGYIFGDDIAIGIDNNISASGKSASEIIFIASQNYNINPQVLLSFLQKESSAVTNNQRAYFHSAMGYACPESRPCDSKYANFAKQVDGAAYQLDYNFKFSEQRDSSKVGAYYAGNTTKIDGKNTFISNSATAALFRYTPHRPDSAYLPADNGGHYYGNYNFISFFYGWFVPGSKVQLPQNKTSGEFLAVVKSLNNEIATFDNQLKVLTAEVSNLDKQIVSSKADIAESDLKIAEQNKYLKDYLKNSYINSQTSIIEALLTSKSFSDFNNKKAYLNLMQTRVQSAKNTIKSEKEKQVKNSKELESSLDLQKSLKIGLEQQIALRKISVSSLSGSQNGARDKLIEILFRGSIGCGNRTATPSKVFAMPVDCGYLAQGYGMTKYARPAESGGNSAYGGLIHNGIDIAIAIGTDIHPIGPGKVYATGVSPSDGWGNWIIIGHNNGKYSLYTHMLSPSTYIKGQEVTVNDVIGGVGGSPYWPAHLNLSVFDGYPKGWADNKVGEYPGNTIDPLSLINISISSGSTDWDEKYKH